MASSYFFQNQAGKTWLVPAYYCLKERIVCSKELIARLMCSYFILLANLNSKKLAPTYTM